MNKTITLFTANIPPFNVSQKKVSRYYSFNDQLHKFCIDSWNKLEPIFNEQGFNLDIKIFDSSSPEWIDFLNVCPYSFKRRSMQVNAFRIYMLSKYDNYLWLDWDVYIPDNLDNFNLDLNDYLFYKIFYVMYNGNNKQFFSNIFNKYLTDEYCRYNYDQAVTKYLKLENHAPTNFQRYFIHLADFELDRAKPIKWLTENDPINYEMYDKYNCISEYRLNINLLNYNSYIFNCYNDSTLINYLREVEKYYSKPYKPLHAAAPIHAEFSKLLSVITV